MSAAIGRVRRAIRSSVRFARTSWTTLTAMLTPMTPSETAASSGRPTMTRSTPSTKITLLMNVKTFSRTIWA